MTTPLQKPDSAVAPLRVRVTDGRELRFTQPFHIGRGFECEVRIDHDHVSRKHVMVSCTNGHWFFCDLRSINGVFVNDERTETGSINGTLTLRLGVDGPSLTLEVEPPAVPTKPVSPAVPAARPPVPPAVLPPPTVPTKPLPPSVLAKPVSIPSHDAPRGGGETMLVAGYVERYFGSKRKDEEVGERTMLIRRAFQKVQSKQKRKYGWIVTVIALAGIAASGYAYYAHRQLRQQQALAEGLFYAMKALDVDIANMERLVAASGTPQNKDQVTTYLLRRREMEKGYDSFLADLKVYGRNLTDGERLILRVTRAFGECELVAPHEYVSEVIRYIRMWQSTPRYSRALRLAQDRGYTRKIAEAFIEQDLPPQFFYLAMQESDFDPLRIGPPTSMGIAKGMWMFIPDTASRYGLALGPLARYPRPDPADDRSQWEKATKAAARYIKDIYATDAQASGLLVMASYNWGEHRVIDLLRHMPANPRERNFWKLLEKHQVPTETYNYVFYIVSAAVIGENPRLFGFPFDNPLLSLIKQ